ncbi:isochorismatase family protein [Streptomyces sp. GQFP]|uniref:isochorismatase family protein n=1 Tax=Streptomyces sp. GQFP TaxID=2907545 RepID=UPI001F2876C8|nr:isochorismatase family protein [Streptomyces sp. GQFP]UIX31149.1 isochorismatase family protein [Streptomyces sp. GQFP]
MDVERRTPANTAIVLIDYITGFANIFRSQTIEANVNGAVALAKTALGFGAPLIVTSGPEGDPRGGLYPELRSVIGEHPVIHRSGSFDAFDFPGFAQAVEDSGVRHLVLAGLMTDGCVHHTALGALRRDYSVSVVVDATADENPEIHQAALTRLTQLGVVPRSWLSLAAEFQRTYENFDTLPVFMDLLQTQAPKYAMSLATLAPAPQVAP